MIDVRIDSFIRSTVQDEYNLDIWDQTNPSVHLVGLKDEQVAWAPLEIPRPLMLEDYASTLAVVLAYVVSHNALPPEVDKLCRTSSLAGILLMAEAHGLRVETPSDLSVDDQRRLAEAQASMHGTVSNHPQANDSKIALFISDTETWTYAIMRGDGELHVAQQPGPSGSTDIVLNALYQQIKWMTK